MATLIATITVMMLVFAMVGALVMVVRGEAVIVVVGMAVVVDGGGSSQCAGSCDFRDRRGSVGSRGIELDKMA